MTNNNCIVMHNLWVFSSWLCLTGTRYLGTSSIMSPTIKRRSPSINSLTLWIIWLLIEVVRLPDCDHLRRILSHLWNFLYQSNTIDFDEESFLKTVCNFSNVFVAEILWRKQKLTYVLFFLTFVILENSQKENSYLIINKFICRWYCIKLNTFVTVARRS